MQRTAPSLVSAVKLLLIASLFTLVSIILGAASAQASEQEPSSGLSLGSLGSATDSLDEVAPLPGIGSLPAETKPTQTPAPTATQNAKAPATNDNDGLLAPVAKPLSNLGDEPVATVIKEVGVSVSPATEVAAAPAKTIVEQAAAPLSTVTEQVGRLTEQAAAPLSTVTEQVGHLTEQAAAPLSTVTEQVGHLTEQAAAPVGTVTGAVAETATAVVDPATELLSNATGSVTTPVAALVEETTDAVTGTVVDVVSEVPVVGVIAEPVEDVISTLPVEETSENDQAVAPVQPIEQLPETSIDTQPEASTSETPAAPIFDPEFPAAEASGEVPTVSNQGLSISSSADEHPDLGAAASTATDTGAPSPSAPAASHAPSAPAGSTLRSSADSGSSGGASAADLPVAYFSLQASGLKAALAESSVLPGSVALEHGFSPD